MPFRSSRIKKKENKLLLQEKVGLPIDADKPLYTIITRLVEQKGLHLVEHILDAFLENDVQLNYFRDRGFTNLNISLGKLFTAIRIN